MQRMCGQCRSRLADNDVFCGNCGARAGLEQEDVPRAPDMTLAAAATPAAGAQADAVIQPDTMYQAPLQAPIPQAPIPQAPRAQAPRAQAPPPTRAPQPRAPGPQAPPRYSSPPTQAPQAWQAPPPPAPAQVRPAPSSPAEAARDGQFFSHADARPAAPMSNTTRYLCAAAYVDPGYANTVIGELTASHRAVVPSRGIDLVPIIRHCLNARKMQLVRDVLLLVLIVVALGLATLPTIVILVAAFFFGGRQRADGVSGSSFAKMLATMILAIVVAAIVIVFLAVKYLNTASRSIPVFGPLATGGLVIVAVLVYLALLAAILITYSYVRNKTLAEKLSPGAKAPQFSRQNERIEARIAEVGAAQYGNVTLFDGQNPFIGTGANPFMWADKKERERAWSIAIELDRAQGTSNGSWAEPEPDSYAPIDPVELHRVLRERLLKLKDPDLPENERISALNVADHVVAEGLRPWESPLIDQERKIPYSLASPEAIEALIRHSQAGLRYYQRVSVSDEGQAVWSGRREVVGSTDQELVISAFIYVAVEGRMFYLEFVPAVLAPLWAAYHAPDFLPKLTSGKFFGRAVKDAATTALGDIVLAPVRVYRTLRTMLAEANQYSKEMADVDDYVYADVGSRISVRELGARVTPRTYIQRLDEAKYTQIVERLVTETVLDFLVANGVDTTAYRASAATVIHNSVSITDSPGAAVAAGRGSSARGHHERHG